MGKAALILFFVVTALLLCKGFSSSFPFLSTLPIPHSLPHPLPISRSTCPSLAPPLIPSPLPLPFPSLPSLSPLLLPFLLFLFHPFTSPLLSNFPSCSFFLVLSLSASVPFLSHAPVAPLHPFLAVALRLRFLYSLPLPLRFVPPLPRHSALVQPHLPVSAQTVNGFL